MLLALMFLRARNKRVWLVVGMSILTLGCVEFDTYYNLDDYDLNFDFEDAITEIQVTKNITRYVDTGEHGISLHLNEDSKPYDLDPELFRQDEEPSFGYCGPTGLKNMLQWYGIDIPYEEAGIQMNTGKFQDRAEAAASCAALCSGEMLICGNICVNTIEKIVNKKGGSNLKDMLKVLKSNTPPGYKFRKTSDDPSMIVELIEQLKKGNPVFVNEYVIGAKIESLHVSVLTGIVVKDNGDVYVRLGNSHNDTLDGFMYRWSIDGFGNSRERRNARRFSDVIPFTAAWYEKAE